MSDLIIAWQDAETRNWLPVGRLSYADGHYYFGYTEGAKVSKNFVPFGWMRDLNRLYESNEIFPLFANRILAKSRPEYQDYLRWIGLSGGEKANDLEVLARTGGVRATDTLEIFPVPAPTSDDKYVGYFLAHGLRYILPENVRRIGELKRGDRLLLVLDVQNPFDRAAIILRTIDPVCMVGYCPRYMATEFCELIRRVGSENVSVTVEQVNIDAPNELKLLCKIVSTWPRDFEPCATGLYKPIVEFDRLKKLRQQETKAPAGT